jgi:hypothetical protein
MRKRHYRLKRRGWPASGGDQARLRKRECPTLLRQLRQDGAHSACRVEANLRLQSYFKLVLFSSCRTRLALPMPTFVPVA